MLIRFFNERRWRSLVVKVAELIEAEVTNVVSESIVEKLSVTLAGTAERSIQNETHEMMTINPVGK